MMRVEVGMKIIWLVGMLGLAGCVYEAPVTPEHSVPIDPAVLGLWEIKPENGPADRMLVLKFSATEYVVHYPMKQDAMYFRAYPVKVDDGTLVQIQFLGTGRQAAAESERRYHVVKYRRDGDVLEVRTVNPEVLGKNLRTSRELQEAIKQKAGDANLFEAPQRFQRVSE
jgi:hypothetical protein